jgi:hypothetical protein
MSETRSSIHSVARNDDDEHLLELTTGSNLGHEKILLNMIDEPMIGINAPDNRESDTEDLLDDIQEESPTTSTSRCSNIPTRYVTAIWAFFGFFTLYAMRVNLSVAIVGMVRMSMI